MGGVGQVGSKKSKPIPTQPRGAGLKFCPIPASPRSCPIPAPPPLWGGENPCGAKWGGAGQAGQGRIAIPSTS